MANWQARSLQRTPMRAQMTRIGRPLTCDVLDVNWVSQWRNKYPRRHTAKTPTHDTEPTTQAERFMWPVIVHR
ncbi:MAG: hypothetical protein E6J34_16395 [Chloroflexi bacterium]|nr:MAG: hypothetical protein E6J34_16395 [Chloroflexota bacterium]